MSNMRGLSRIASCIAHAISKLRGLKVAAGTRRSLEELLKPHLIICTDSVGTPSRTEVASHRLLNCFRSRGRESWPGCPAHTSLLIGWEKAQIDWAQIRTRPAASSALRGLRKANWPSNANKKGLLRRTKASAMQTQITSKSHCWILTLSRYSQQPQLHHSTQLRLGRFST